MRLYPFFVPLFLICELAVPEHSETFPGVARIQTQPGHVIIGDAFFSGESSAISSITNLVNEELSYFSYSSPTDSRTRTYFFYAQPLKLEFSCVVLVNGDEVARNSNVVEVEAEPGQLYIAKPAYLGNYSTCETKFLPQQRPNKGFNRTPESSGPAKPGKLSGGAG